MAAIGGQQSSGFPINPDITRIRPFYLLLMVLFVLLACLFPQQGLAEKTITETRHPQQTHSLTLAEMIQRGVAASPRLMAQRHIIDQAEAQLKQARAGRLPRLEYLQILGVVNGAHGDANWSPDDRTDLLNDLGPFTKINITLIQPLYTFGRLKSHIEAAQSGLEAKEASLDRFKLELVMTLKDLYYTLLLNNELYRLVSDTEKQFTKAVEKSEALLEADDGTLTQQDLLKLRYGLFRAKGQLLEIKKGKRLVHAAIKRLLFLPEEEDFKIEEKRLKPLKVELKGLKTYQDLAREKRPAWKELEAGVTARKAELKAEKRQYFPNLFLGGTFRYAVAPNRDKQLNPFAWDDFNHLDGGIYGGLRLDFDFGIPQRIAEKQAELFTLVQEQREATSGMLLEVEKAFCDVEEKEQGLTFAREARKNGRALAATSAASFHIGLGEAKALFEAFGIYTEAAAKYYLAIKDYNVAVAELARVCGTEYLEGEPADTLAKAR